MDQPVAEPDPSAPVAGLFGKLPAHGDFVRRGWPDETVDAVDRWLSETIASARATRDEPAFAAWMHAAPLWRGYVPPGQLGPHALHLAVAPSIDRAGRIFPLAAGVAGEPGAVWDHAAYAGQAVDAAIYDALAGCADADGTVEAIAGSLRTHAGARDDAPSLSAWWLRPEGAPVLERDTVDASLLLELMGEGQR